MFKQLRDVMEEIYELAFAIIYSNGKRYWLMGHKQREFWILCHKFKNKTRYRWVTYYIYTIIYNHICYYMTKLSQNLFYAYILFTHVIFVIL